LTIAQDGVFHQWLTALEARHLADLRVPEVTRALRALSSAYVQRRHKVTKGATLDSAGKRAAFALYYGPLHFITVARVLHELARDAPPPAAILDLGCGTGVAGAAWARHAGGSPFVTGLDRHPWAVEEARWTYRQMGLRGQARAGDLTRNPSAARGAIVVAYALNEVLEGARTAVEDRLLKAAASGVALLIVEPIARGIAPWWDSLAARVAAIGGRSDEWRFAVDLPPLLRLFDKAAGLDHRELTARTLYVCRDRDPDRG
jgi:protein-L-isoaspartate O-methyltransferase